MPFKMTNYLEDVLINLLLRNVAWGAQPATTYLSLFTSFNEASDGNTYTEVAGTGYVRRPITWGAPVSAESTNSVAISFPAALSNWGTITNFGIWSAMTGGNMLYWGEITTPLSINLNEQYDVAVDELDLTISGNVPSAIGNAVINTTCRNTTWAFPTTDWYISLLSSYTSDSLYTEVTDVNYHRQSITFSASSLGVTSNSNELLWDPAAADFSVSYVGIFDDAAAGNLLFRAPLVTPKTVGANKVFKIPIGNLTVTAD